MEGSDCLMETSPDAEGKTAGRGVRRRFPMFDRLDDIVKHYEEIMLELNNPSVTEDQKRFRKLMFLPLHSLILALAAQMGRPLGPLLFLSG